MNNILCNFMETYNYSTNLLKDSMINMNINLNSSVISCHLVAIDSLPVILK